MTYSYRFKLDRDKIMKELANKVTYHEVLLTTWNKLLNFNKSLKILKVFINL